ncbi:DNA repair protein RAD51 homolog 4 isoform X2 [Anguilla anguilla]|uniref:DNA repair protein RAD51 homolog 4 isoform X2 n=1 Tax=Anguilla anguilla TaxID=7936 RepID=UPI0015B0135F|nr:DNA repair protein RAD51 homolog 4 isoform X2 [Anguilla anguilla]
MVFLREGLCPGLSEEFIQILRTKDVRTVEDLVSSDTEELAQKCSVSYKALVAVRRVLLAQHTAFPVSGADLYEELLSSTAILSTGNASLDKLLDTGLYTGELTELAGTPGSGKTQMEAFQRIQVAQVFDVFSLLECLHNLRSGGFQQMSAGGGTLKAVIVDSVTAVLSHILGGKQTDGMSLMMQVAGELKTIAKDLNVAVLVTNHVTRDGSGILKAGLGLSWSHVPRTRVLLECMENPGSAYCSLRTATLIKSSRQPCNLTQEFDLNSWGETEIEPPGPSGKRKLVDEDPSQA